MTEHEKLREELIEFIGLDRRTSRFVQLTHKNRKWSAVDCVRPRMKASAGAQHSTARRTGIRQLIPAVVDSAVDQLLKPNPLEMRPKTRLWLRDHYREQNHRLEEFLRRDLSAWS